MLKYAAEVAALFFLLGSLPAKATVEMSLTLPDETKKLGQTLPALSFLNEENQKVSLFHASQDKAFLLLPFYAHCKSTCPLNVAHLKDALRNSKESHFQVVLFSFNPGDTSEDLKNFRQALQVPSSWEIIRASAKDTNALLETLDFRYMTQGADFVHTNTIVVLSPNLKIFKFIQGLAYTANTIDDSIREARRLEAATASSPLPVIAFAIVAFVLGGVSFWARQESRKRIAGGFQGQFQP